MPHPLEHAPLAAVDPNRGFLCLWTYWQPDADASAPEMPGLKQHTLTYLPVHPNTRCLCGSGLPYRRCCRLRPYWQAVCLNPNSEAERYSLVAPQTAQFASVQGAVLRTRLSEDQRFKQVEDTLPHAFWIYWGDPACEGQFGTLCFGDIELQQNTDMHVVVEKAPISRVKILPCQLPDSDA